MRGVPLRIEVGPRDIKENQAVLVRRDTLDKEMVSLDRLREKTSQVLEQIQQNLFAEALKFQQANTYDVQSYEELKTVIESKRGFAKAFWCGNQNCEEKIKEETMATIRVIVFSQEKPQPSGKCIFCQKKAENFVYFARAY